MAGTKLLPEPSSTTGIAIENASGSFDVDQLIAWSEAHGGRNSSWHVASVHRGAADRLTAAVGSWAEQEDAACPLRRLTYRDIRLQIDVLQPDKVGIDRLLAGLAADSLRDRERAAIVVDLGTAITVDLITVDGAFAGGAILPGIGISARALAEQTDALPRLEIDQLDAPPAAIGRSTSAAIEAGLYWGAVGAIRELIARQSADLANPPQVFLTGGASMHVAELIGEDWQVRHVPNLVLSGIALAAGGL